MTHLLRYDFSYVININYSCDIYTIKFFKHVISTIYD
jgi:hypothetical protein